MKHYTYRVVCAGPKGTHVVARNQTRCQAQRLVRSQTRLVSRRYALLMQREQSK